MTAENATGVKSPARRDFLTSLVQPDQAIPETPQQPVDIKLPYIPGMGALLGVSSLVIADVVSRREITRREALQQYSLAAILGETWLLAGCTPDQTTVTSSGATIVPEPELDPTQQPEAPPIPPTIEQMEQLSTALKFQRDVLQKFQPQLQEVAKAKGSGLSQEEFDSFIAAATFLWGFDAAGNRVESIEDGNKVIDPSRAMPLLVRGDSSAGIDRLRENSIAVRLTGEFQEGDNILPGALMIGSSNVNLESFNRNDFATLIANPGKLGNIVEVGKVNLEDGVTLHTLIETDSDGRIIDYVVPELNKWLSRLGEDETVSEGFFRLEELSDRTPGEEVYALGVEGPLPAKPEGAEELKYSHTQIDSGGNIVRLVEVREDGTRRDVWEYSVELERWIDADVAKVERFVENSTHSILHESITSVVTNFDVRASQQLQEDFGEDGPLYAIVHSTEALQAFRDNFPLFFVRDMNGEEHILSSESNKEKKLNIVFITDDEPAIEEDELPLFRFIDNYGSSSASGFAYEANNEINMMVKLPIIFTKYFNRKASDPMDLWMVLNGLFHQIQRGRVATASFGENYIVIGARSDTEYDNYSTPRRQTGNTYAPHLFCGSPGLGDFNGDGIIDQWYTPEFYRNPFIAAQFPPDIDLSPYQINR